MNYVLLEFLEALSEVPHLRHNLLYIFVEF